MAKRKKQKKNKSNKKNNQKSQPKQDIPEICLKDSVDGLYKGYFKKASNFDRQLKRIETGVPIIAKKLQKAGDFNQSADAIASIASSCPTLEERIEALFLAAELGACYQNITDNCQAPEVNQTRIDECTPIVEGFQNETTVCKDLSGDDACDCWEGPFQTFYKDLSGCVIKNSEENVTDRLKECKKAVGYCNKRQREAFSLYAQCNPKSPATPTPVVATSGYVTTNVGTPSPFATPFNMSNPLALVTKYSFFSANFLNRKVCGGFEWFNDQGQEQLAIGTVAGTPVDVPVAPDFNIIGVSAHVGYLLDRLEFITEDAQNPSNRQGFTCGGIYGTPVDATPPGSCQMVNIAGTTKDQDGSQLLATMEFTWFCD